MPFLLQSSLHLHEFVFAICPLFPSNLLGRKANRMCAKWLWLWRIPYKLEMQGQYTWARFSNVFFVNIVTPGSAIRGIQFRSEAESRFRQGGDDMRWKGVGCCYFLLRHELLKIRWFKPHFLSQATSQLLQHNQCNKCKQQTNQDRETVTVC